MGNGYKILIYKRIKEVDQKEKFKRWAKVELKIYKEELEKEKGSEKLIRAIDEEIERREKNDN